jgi:hypothetical protein
MFIIPLYLLNNGFTVYLIPYCLLFGKLLWNCQSIINSLVDTFDDINYTASPWDLYCMQLENNLFKKIQFSDFFKIVDFIKRISRRPSNAKQIFSSIDSSWSSLQKRFLELLNTMLPLFSPLVLQMFSPMTKRG